MEEEALGFLHGTEVLHLGIPPPPLPRINPPKKKAALARRGGLKYSRCQQGE